MAVLPNAGFGAGTNMCTALGGNVEATNRVQRRADRMGYGALLRITTVVGTTCTYLVEGSPDNVAWVAQPLQDLPTAGGPPGTLTSATFVITTAATFWKLLPVDIPWIFLRVTFSANTGITNTIDLFAY